MTLNEMFDELGIPDVLDYQAITPEAVALSVGVLNYFASTKPRAASTGSGRGPGRPTKEETAARLAEQQAQESVAEAERKPGPTQEPSPVSPEETSGSMASTTGPSNGPPEFEEDPEETKISHDQKVTLAKLRIELGISPGDLKGLCEKHGMPRLAPPGEGAAGDLTVAEWALLTTKLMPELAASATKAG